MEDQSNYSLLREELESIVLQVRSKDVPLEKCLDLFDEALKIGGQCVEAIDRTDFSFAVEEEASDVVDKNTADATNKASVATDDQSLPYVDDEQVEDTAAPAQAQEKD